jgi:hypothetical protein
MTDPYRTSTRTAKPASAIVIRQIRQLYATGPAMPLTEAHTHGWALVVVSAAPRRLSQRRKPNAVPLGAPTSVGTWDRRTQPAASAHTGD